MGGERARDERGQGSVLVIGFAVVLVLLVVVVVDASAAFLRRQDLDTLADGAALAGADAGAQGEEVYTTGLDDSPLVLTSAQARAGVARYLAQVHAFRDHPGLSYDVDVRGDRVEVRVSAPADLPLDLPGSPDGARVSATGTAAVDPD